MGRPVVSTTVGVEGLDVKDGLHLLMADDPAAFDAAILRLLDDGELRGRMAKAARALLEDRFSWSHAARQVEAVCQRALGAKTPPGNSRANDVERLQDLRVQELPQT